MRIGIPREVQAGERRVAVSPGTVEKLVASGFEVAVEAGAGERASFRDGDYTAAGATLVAGARALWQAADMVLKVRPPADHPGEGCHEVELLKEGGTLVSLLWP